MSLEAQTGPYMHAPGMRFQKTFEAGRSFYVIAYSAYNAMGLIGTEHNGIAILDKDNETIVLDQHASCLSGMRVPTKTQRQEIKRIMNMDWPEFSKFCREHPRYRGVLPDASKGTPDFPLEDARDAQEWWDSLDHAVQSDMVAQFSGAEADDLRETFEYHDVDLADFQGFLASILESSRKKIKEHVNRMIFDPEKIDKDSPYSFPCTGRKDIIELLSRHSCHGERSSGFRLSWNIKVGDFNSDGKQSQEDYPTKAEFDETWEKLLALQNAQLFSTACEDASSYFFEGLYTTYSGDDQGEYKFATQGRSGGHLVLTECGEFRGKDLAWENRQDMIESLMEMDDEDLCKLYRVVCHLDQDLTPQKIRMEMEFQFSFIRSQAEEAWSAGDDYLGVEHEPATTPELAE